MNIRRIFSVHFSWTMKLEWMNEFRCENILLETFETNESPFRHREGTNLRTDRTKSSEFSRFEAMSDDVPSDVAANRIRRRRSKKHSYPPMTRSSNRWRQVKERRTLWMDTDRESENRAEKRGIANPSERLSRRAAVTTGDLFIRFNDDLGSVLLAIRGEFSGRG